MNQPTSSPHTTPLRTATPHSAERTEWPASGVHTPSATPTPPRHSAELEAYGARSAADGTAEWLTEQPGPRHPTLRDVRRRAEWHRAEQNREDAERSAVTLRTRRIANAKKAERRPTADEIAPTPRWMLVIGVWLDRTIGVIPLLAPLIVSGYFTMQVFLGRPLHVMPPIAVAVTCALEGGVWLLARLYDKTLLEGDSTIALRIMIFGYLAVISGGIYWHAWYTAYELGQPIGWGWVPAAVAGAMSVAGVLIWGRRARFLHRVKLRELGLMDKQMPKFSFGSWFFHPVETIGALRHAIRYRLDSPVDAMADHRYWRQAGRPTVWPPAGAEYAVDVAERSERAMRSAEHADRGARTVERAAATHGAVNGVLNGAPGGVPTPRSTEYPTERGVGRPVESHANVNGVSGVAGDGARSAAERGADDGVFVDDEALRYSDDILAIAAACPTWQTKLPTYKEGVRIIREDRTRRTGEESTFKSEGQVQKIYAVMNRLKTLADTDAALTQLSSAASALRGTN